MSSRSGNTKNIYFDKLEIMDTETRNSYVKRRLTATVQYAYKHSPRARKLLDTAGVTATQIRSLGDLARLPIVRKLDVIDWQKQHPPYGGLFTGQPEEAERIFVSPGPIYEPHQTAKIKWFSKSFWAAGFRSGDVVLNAFTYHMSPAGILFHEGLGDCGATVSPPGTGTTDIQVQTLRELRVNGFVGTPSFLMIIIKRAEEMGLNFRRDCFVKRAWFTGEMLAPSLRQVFENDFGIDTYQTYAVTEPGGAIAYECCEKTGMHFMDEYIIEIVDPSTGVQLGPGEVGEIVVTPVHNKLWGLLRFGTGDLSSYTADPCACGRTSYRLNAILGRTGDAIKVRGMFLVARQAEQVLTDFSTISRFQFLVTRQQERDAIILRAETKEPLTNEKGKALVSQINQKFQDVCRLKLDYIDFIKHGTLADQAAKIVDQRVWK